LTLKSDSECEEEVEVRKERREMKKEEKGGQRQKAYFKGSRECLSVDEGQGLTQNRCQRSRRTIQKREKRRGKKAER